MENLVALIRRARAAGEASPACRWCGTRTASHVVLGDPLCKGCYAEHRGEVALGR